MAVGADGDVEVSRVRPQLHFPPLACIRASQIEEVIRTLAVRLLPSLAETRNRHGAVRYQVSAVSSVGAEAS
jgi:hypothetical protein